MRTYIIRRVLLLIPTFLLLTVLVFLSVRFLPGDAVDVMMARLGAAEGASAMADFDREKVVRMLGLDVPTHVQYVRWLGGIFLRGTLGDSLLGGFTVEEKIIGRLPITVELGVLAILIGLVIAVPVGIYFGGAAGHRGRLRRPLHRHHRSGDAQFLARHPGADLPRDLVGVGAAAAHGDLRGGSDPESQLHDHSQPHSGHLPVGNRHAHDAHHDAGGAAPGLHPYRLGEGTARAGDHPPARDQECADPGGDADRPATPDPGRRLGDHGKHVRPCRGWAG